MKLSIRAVNSRIIQIQTELAAYTAVKDPDGQTVTLVGPGLVEEHEVGDFPGEDPELYAIAAYLIASLEAKLYGD